jgi:NADH-quinone oxidoreductase subunit A
VSSKWPGRRPARQGRSGGFPARLHSAPLRGAAGLTSLKAQAATRNADGPWLGLVARAPAPSAVLDLPQLEAPDAHLSCGHSLRTGLLHALQHRNSRHVDQWSGRKDRALRAGRVRPGVRSWPAKGMGSRNMNPYVIFLLYLTAILGFVALTLLLNRIVGPKPVASATKLEPFECGATPVSTLNVKAVPIKYYAVAIVFILFDLETIFLFIWALGAQPLTGTMLLTFFFFMFLLVLIVLYVYKARLIEMVTE